MHIILLYLMFYHYSTVQVNISMRSNLSMKCTKETILWKMKYLYFSQNFFISLLIMLYKYITYCRFSLQGDHINVFSEWKPHTDFKITYTHFGMTIDCEKLSNITLATEWVLFFPWVFHHDKFHREICE